MLQRLWRRGRDATSPGVREADLELLAETTPTYTRSDIVEWAGEREYHAVLAVYTLRGKVVERVYCYSDVLLAEVRRAKRVAKRAAEEERRRLENLPFREDATEESGTLETADEPLHQEAGAMARRTADAEEHREAQLRVRRRAEAGARRVVVAERRGNAQSKAGRKRRNEVRAEAEVEATTRREAAEQLRRSAVGPGKRLGGRRGQGSPSVDGRALEPVRRRQIGLRLRLRHVRSLVPLAQSGFDAIRDLTANLEPPERADLAPILVAIVIAIAIGVTVAFVM